MTGVGHGQLARMGSQQLVARVMVVVGGIGHGEQHAGVDHDHRGDVADSVQNRDWGSVLRSCGPAIGVKGGGAGPISEEVIVPSSENRARWHRNLRRQAARSSWSTLLGGCKCQRWPNSAVPSSTMKPTADGLVKRGIARLPGRYRR